MRLTATAAALVLALAAAGVGAQDARLPDIGSSAAEMIDPATQADYGAYLLYELRRLGLVVDDPLVDDWQPWQAGRQVLEPGRLARPAGGCGHAWRRGWRR